MVLNSEMPKNIVMFAPNWPSITFPEGKLVRDDACQALWHYYITAIETWKREESHEVIKYEGQDDFKPNYKQLIHSIARVHGVTVEDMVGYWNLVDQQIWKMGHTALPKSDKYRFV